MTDPAQENQPSGDQPVQPVPQETGDQQPAQPVETAPQEPPVQQPTQRENISTLLEYIAGFLGWFLVMLLHLLFQKAPGAFTTIMCVFQGVALLVLFLTKKRRAIAWGMLTAIGLNFVICLAQGLIINMICFIPFFNPVPLQ